jgi:ribokinase
VRIVDEPTGCAFITVDETGENAITVASGANMALSAADLPQDLLSKASVLVLQMEVPLGENLEAAARARQAGVRVVWNFAPVPGRDRARRHDGIARGDRCARRQRA